MKAPGRLIMEENTLANSPPITTSNYHDNNNAKTIPNSSIVREEGELSASENDVRLQNPNVFCSIQFLYVYFLLVLRVC